MLAFVAVASSAITQPVSGASGWGCEVLLCAASSAPSWQGVPYCIPPMTRLIRHLHRGGDWPRCPSSGAELGFEPWLPCRDGYRPAQRNDRSARDGEGAQPNEICRSVESRRVCGMQADDDGRASYACRQVHSEYARELHPRPYYYAIRSADGSIGRYHFSLSR